MRSLPALLLLALAAACGDDVTQPPPEEKPDSARLHGGFVGITRLPVELELGEIFLTVQGPLAPDATEQVFTTGSLLPYGYSLAGTYAKDGQLDVDGGSYTVTATTSGDVLRGTYTAPSSAGAVVLASSGVFVYCGTTDGDDAVLVVEVADKKLHGVIVSAEGSSPLEGLRTENTFDLSSSDARRWHLTATVANNQDVSGVAESAGGSGTWTASTFGCTGIQSEP